MSANEFRKKINSGEIRISEKGRSSFGKADPAINALNNWKKERESEKAEQNIKIGGRKAFEDYITQDTINKMIDECYKKGSIYIPFNVCSSKNSKQIVGKGKKKSLIHSKQYRKYKLLSGAYWQSSKMLFKKLTEKMPKPLLIGMFYIRSSEQSFDHHNMHQGPADLMQEFDWIDDDNMKNMKIYPEGYIVDKERAGVIITPLKSVSQINSRRFINKKK